MSPPPGPASGPASDPVRGGGGTPWSCSGFCFWSSASVLCYPATTGQGGTLTDRLRLSAVMQEEFLVNYIYCRTGKRKREIEKSQCLVSLPHPIQRVNLHQARMKLAVQPKLRSM